jgi:hypothetical protein
MQHVTPLTDGIVVRFHPDFAISKLPLKRRIVKIIVAWINSCLLFFEVKKTIAEGTLRSLILNDG